MPSGKRGRRTTVGGGKGSQVRSILKLGATELRGIRRQSRVVTGVVGNAGTAGICSYRMDLLGAHSNRYSAGCQRGNRSRPKKNMNFVVCGDFASGRQKKYEVRSTKYEVKELGATELRRGVGKRQSWNLAWGTNPCTREDEAPLVHRASATRMRISMAAILENFIGTGVTSRTFFPHEPIAYHTRHSLAMPLRTSYFVPRTSYWATETRMGTSIAAICRNFHGAGVKKFKKKQEQLEQRGGMC